MVSLYQFVLFGQYSSEMDVIKTHLIFIQTIYENDNSENTCPSSIKNIDEL